MKKIKFYINQSIIYYEEGFPQKYKATIVGIEKKYALKYRLRFEDPTLPKRFWCSKDKLHYPPKINPNSKITLEGK